MRKKTRMKKRNNQESRKDIKRSLTKETDHEYDKYLNILCPCIFCFYFCILIPGLPFVLVYLANMSTVKSIAIDFCQLFGVYIIMTGYFFLKIYRAGNISTLGGSSWWEYFVAVLCTIVPIFLILLFFILLE